MTPARPLALLLALALTTPVLAQAPAKPAWDVMPQGAPSDDYEFVGWCAGTLTGHMALFDSVQPTLKEISKRWNSEAADERDYAAKQVAGRDLLARFADAMKAAEKASTQALAPRGQRAITMGRDKWAGIDAIDANSRAYSWMNWGLPERCERVAAQLKSRATLMGVALRDNSQNAVQASAVRAVGDRPPEGGGGPSAAPSASPPAPASGVAPKPVAASGPAADKVVAAAKPTAIKAEVKTQTSAAPKATAEKPASTAAGSPTIAAPKVTAAAKPNPAVAAPTPQAKPPTPKPAVKPEAKPAAKPQTPPAAPAVLRGSATPTY